MGVGAKHLSGSKIGQEHILGNPNGGISVRVWGLSFEVSSVGLRFVFFWFCEPFLWELKGNFQPFGSGRKLLHKHVSGFSPVAKSSFEISPGRTTPTGGSRMYGEANVVEWFLRESVPLGW